MGLLEKLFPWKFGHIYVGALDKKSNRHRIARNLQWKLKYGTKNAFCHVKVSIILAQLIHYSLRHRNRHSSLLRNFHEPVII